MQETPMFFPMSPDDFWKQIKETVEEVVSEKLNQAVLQTPINHLPEKAFLKINDVCAVFQVSKPMSYHFIEAVVFHRKTFLEYHISFCMSCREYIY